MFQNPLATIEEERREHQAKMTKMEKEMEEVFERKVREKKNKLNDSEIDLEKRHRESKEKLDSQKRELEAQRAAFLVTIYIKTSFNFKYAVIVSPFDCFTFAKLSQYTV